MDTSGFSIGKNDTPRYSNLAIQAVTSLLDENELNPKDAYEAFIKLADERLMSGKPPNPAYGESIDLLSRLISYQDVIDKVQVAKTKTKNKIFDNIIYDNVLQMNGIMGNSVFKFPDVVNISQSEEIRSYKQALIEVQNVLPQTSGKERMDLLWVNNLLNNYIEYVIRTRNYY